MSFSKLKVIFSKEKFGPETCGGPSVCECTKPSRWQKFQHVFKEKWSEVKIVIAVCNMLNAPCVFICLCECHESMAKTLYVEEPTSPTTTEQKTTFGN
jgi:hypothetical protein